MLALKNLWTPTSRLYNRADEGQPRRFVLDCSIAWQNYRDDAGVFQEIDLTPEIVPGGFRVRKVPYDLTLLTTGERRIAPNRAFPTRFIRFPANRFLAGKTFTRIGNSLVWQSNAYNIVLRWGNSGIKFDVVLKRSVPFDSVSFDVDKMGIDDATLLSYLANLKAIDSSQPMPIVRPLNVSLVAGVLTLGFDLTGMTFPVTIDPTLDLQVGASADDGYGRFDATPDLATTAYDLTFGKVGTSQYRLFTRFTGVTGLQGATVDVSYWRSRCQRTATVTTLVYAFDYEAPTSPTSGADWNTKTLTTASVAWNQSLTIYTVHDSPSLNPVIQELADSYNPSAIVIDVRDNNGADYSAFDSYDIGVLGPPYTIPKLHIEYTAAAVGQPYISRVQQVAGMRSWGGF